MLRSLRTAEKAMQMEQLRVEALANNLANASSSGFKQILTTAQQPGRGGVDDPRVARTPVATGTRWRPAGTPGDWPAQTPVALTHATDARQGTLQPTGRSTDLALAGEGFFVVETPAGELYTRDGSLRIDGQSRLVTAAGHPVIGEGGPIKLEGRDLAVSEDGSLSVDGNAVGRLRVVTFAEPSRLEHRGASLLAPPPDMQPTDLPRVEVRVQQGMLEASNVNPVETLVDMIAAQRSFEVASRVLMANDELLEKSVNQLPKSR
jgi:flagellar basal-body rod protein FlgG